MDRNYSLFNVIADINDAARLLWENTYAHEYENLRRIERDLSLALTYALTEWDDTNEQGGTWEIEAGMAESLPTNWVVLVWVQHRMYNPPELPETVMYILNNS